MRASWPSVVRSTYARFSSATALSSSEMLEELYFALGLVNNLFLVLIFVVRGTRGIGPLRRIGPFYLLLAFPAAYGIILVAQEQKAPQYGVFLGIFLAFLALEGLYDFVWKIPFRENWKPLVPYLALYFAMNYGFVALVWKASLTEGLLLLGLFILQIVVNVATHGPWPAFKARAGWHG